MPPSSTGAGWGSVNLSIAYLPPSGWLPGYPHRSAFLQILDSPVARVARSAKLRAEHAAELQFCGAGSSHSAAVSTDMVMDAHQ